MSVILDFLVDFIYPKSCVVCEKNGVFLCETCLAGLERARQTCPVCGRDSLGGWTHPRCVRPNSLAGLTTIYSYKDPKVRKVIEAIKFGFNKELIPLFPWNTGAFPPTLGGNNNEEILVVPVPLHRLRLNWRGFNQAEEIGKAIGQPLGLSNILVRVKNTKQQAKLASHKERKENVRGAFALVPHPIPLLGKERVKGKNILLVDDVFTTGESMKECCRVLKRAGAKEVWGWVLAR